MHLCDVSGVAEGQHLPVNAPAADDEAALSGAGKCRRFLGAAADRKAGNLRPASAQRHVDPPRKRLFSRKILDGTPSRDYHCPAGGRPEKFPVGGQGDGLRPVPADSPVVVNRNDQFHRPTSDRHWDFKVEGVEPIVFHGEAVLGKGVEVGDALIHPEGRRGVSVFSSMALTAGMCRS